MRVILLEPGRDSRIRNVRHGIRELENMLGGPAEVTSPFGGGILLVRLRNQAGQPVNRLIAGERVYGRCFLCGCSLHGISDFPEALTGQYCRSMDRCRLQ